MARKKKTPEASVVVLETSVGEKLVIRANPSDDEVRSFVEEHSKRFTNGAPGGPSGIPAFQIYNAWRYASEADLLNEGDALEEIDVADLIP